MSQEFRTRLLTGLPMISAIFLASSLAIAQVTPVPVAVVIPSVPQPIVAVVNATEKLPEGTEIKVRLDQALSSATAVAGDTFAISTVEEIRLPNGTVIPAGYRGKGTVTAAEKRGMLGKAGQLDVSLDYVRIGEVRVHLRANKGGEGKSGVTTTIVLSLLITPLFLMHHGHEMVFPKGQVVTTYVDDDATIALPLAPAPKDD